jgi:transcriptional/translational regulatory protein YebC/TACO1
MEASPDQELEALLAIRPTRWRAQSRLQSAVAEITYRADITIELNDDDRLKMQKIIDALEDLDDVQEVYHNAAL